MTRPTPSLGAILGADYACVLLIIAPLVAAGIAAWERYDGGGHTFALAAAAVTALCVPLLVLRLRAFYAVFRDGVEVPGEVLAVETYKDRGTVTYAFELDGRRHEVSRGIHLNARTRRLARGQEVVVIVDPRRPDGALLRDLFV